MIALLVFNLCVVLWFLARIGSERRQRITLSRRIDELELQSGTQIDSSRERYLSLRMEAMERLACDAWNVACAARHNIQALERKEKTS